MSAIGDPKRTFGASFNHLVGDGKHRRWHLDAEHSRRLQIDEKLELGRFQRPEGREEPIDAVFTCWRNHERAAFGSKHREEQPTKLRGVAEYARANRSDQFANWLRSQNDAIVLKF